MNNTDQEQRQPKEEKKQITIARCKEAITKEEADLIAREQDRSSTDSEGS